jgi:sulfide:quinone oxidoreductase
MKIVQLSPLLSISDQLEPSDLGVAAAQGFRSVINNRPDREAEEQPTSSELQAAAERLGLAYRHVPVVADKVTDEDVEAFASAVKELNGPVLAFCRTGARSTSLWALWEAWHLEPDTILKATSGAGYNREALRPRLGLRASASALFTGTVGMALRRPTAYDVVIVGGGAGGISTASSLLRRRAGLSIAIIEPRETHYYQPGWTLVGGGVFDRSQTERPMARVMPKALKWIRSAVAQFAPEQNAVVLEDGERVSYRTLIVAPGIELNWDGVEGLRETLGKNGVTSNYMFEMAPYTFELVRSLRKGRALFTQPPMPIKCAGAPQKAMYLCCDHWLRDGVLNDIEVEFHLAGPVLFGVDYYVPSLMRYVERYGAKLNFTSNLKAVDGPGKKAFFEVKSGESAQMVERSFDMLHVCPPQRAPKVVRESPLADKAGWVEVNPATLQHARYANIFAVGDASSAPNAKTAAAVRKQAPVVAENTLRVLEGQAPRAVYDGYGSCPLTVERGKIVLAEFGYGGKLLPTFPFLDGKKPSRLAWFLKENMLPTIYWELMLKGHEWLARPEMLPHVPAAPARW